MPVIKQKMIFREDLWANPGTLYLFGDNNKREGLGGQAKEMRGEPNAVGIRTKWGPSMHAPDFFYDDQWDEAHRMIMVDAAQVIPHLESGGIVVVPLDGLGTGLADLPRRAPRIFKFLEDQIEYLTTIPPWKQ